MVTSAQAYWLNRKRRQKRNAAEETPPLSVADFFGATSGFYPISLATCFKDTACTIPCTADGDLIKGITPLYGELPNLIQATDANCFILRDDGGGRWRADFDATDTMVSAASVTVARQHLIGLARELASAGTSILFGVAGKVWGFYVHRAAEISAEERTVANSALAALQGRTL